jgi:hypothetical protein
MARTIGERAADRYIKHPAASAANPLAEAYAIDSGTIQLYQHNLHVLQRERLSTLVACVGPFDVPDYTSQVAQWGGLAEPSPNTIGFDNGAKAIPWHRATAARFGPFFGVQDYELDDGRRTLRPVRCAMSITVDAGATSHSAFFALTKTDARPSDGHLAFESVALAAGATTFAVADDLVCAGPVASELYRCRPDGVSAPDGPLSVQTSVRATGFYVWFGWLVVDGGTGTSVNSMSAWEVDP